MIACAADRNCAFLEADGHSISSGQQVNQVHKLDLADPADHQAAHGLADLANSLGWECWRTATLDDKPLKLSSKVIASTSVRLIALPRSTVYFEVA